MADHGEEGGPVEGRESTPPPSVRGGRVAPMDPVTALGWIRSSPPLKTSARGNLKRRLSLQGATSSSAVRGPVPIGCDDPTHHPPPWGNPLRALRGQALSPRRSPDGSSCPAPLLGRRLSLTTRPRKRSPPHFSRRIVKSIRRNRPRPTGVRFHPGARSAKPLPQGPQRCHAQPPHSLV